MENMCSSLGLAVHICSRNPIVIWAVEHLLAPYSPSWRFATWSPSQPLSFPEGIHIVLIDVCSMAEWPEVVQKWTSAGHRAIVLVPENWGGGAAELRALHIGVRGIVYVSGDFVHLLSEAVNRVASGQLFANEESLDEFYYGRVRPRSTVSYLSFREEQVIDLLLKGLSNRKIGTVLGISERTAKFHVCNILRKLGVTNRRELVDKDSNLIWPSTQLKRRQSPLAVRSPV